MLSLKLLILLFLTLSSFIGSGYLFLTRRNLRSDKLLAFYLLCLGVIFLNSVFHHLSGSINPHPLIIYISLLFFVACLCIAPTVYLYLVSLFETEEANQILQRKMAHYLPAVVLLCINTFAFVSLFNMESDSVLAKDIESVKRYSSMIAIFFVFLIQNVAYIYLSYHLYRRRSIILRGSQDIATNPTLVWMRDFLISYSILILSMYLFQIKGFEDYKVIFRMLLVAYIGFIVYYGSKNYAFVVEAKKEEKIDTQKQDEIIKDLEHLMRTQKVYLDTSLSIHSLAKQLQTNTKYLSYVINKKYNKNYSSYINQMRIQEAKRMLSDANNDVYTLETIAQMAGFKSKSSFNSSFKKETNLTPSSYRTKDR